MTAALRRFLDSAAGDALVILGGTYAAIIAAALILGAFFEAIR